MAGFWGPFEDYSVNEILGRGVGAAARPIADAGRALRGRQLRQAGVRSSGSGRGQQDRTGSPDLLRQQGSRKSGSAFGRINAGPDRGGAPGTGRGPAGPAGAAGMNFDDILAMLAGGEGGGIDTSALAGSYDAEIAALRQGGQRIGGLTNQLIGNINQSASGANKQIGSFFDYAAGQAQAGRPVIGASYDAARTNVDQSYDQLASRIGALPQTTADAARAAGGSAAGSSVADRVAVAAAPFAAAGESARAASQSNLAAHSTAGQDYLTQLAAAAPSEAAQSQAAVTGRANQAVTNAQMQLAAQQAEIEARAASIEGSKQRALLEASADTAGSTAERMMQAIQLTKGMQDIGAMPLGPHAQQDGVDPKDALEMQNLMLTIAGKQKGLQDPEDAWQEQLAGVDPRTASMAAELRAASEANPDLNLGQVINGLTSEKPQRVRRGFFGRLFGEDYKTEDTTTAKTVQEFVEQILAGQEGASMRSNVDPETLRHLLRQLPR